MVPLLGCCHAGDGVALASCPLQAVLAPSASQKPPPGFLVRGGRLKASLGAFGARDMTQLMGSGLAPGSLLRLWVPCWVLVHVLPLPQNRSCPRDRAHRLCQEPAMSWRVSASSRVQVKSFRV